MKIKRIRTAVVEGNFDWTFVRIDTDNDFYGTGESFFAPGLTCIIKDISEIILGEDPRNIDVLVYKLLYASSGAGSSAGIVINAISGIETALWDLLGKYYNVPIYQFLGGTYRDKIPLYIDCHAGEHLERYNSVLLPQTPSWSKQANQQQDQKKELPIRFFGKHHEQYTPEAYVASANKKINKGYKALKFDIDIPTPYIRDHFNRTLSNMEIKIVKEIIGAVREAVGWEIELAVDCHWRYSVSDALRLSKELQEFKLLWLEDPVPPTNMKALKQVAQNSKIPICTGENIYLKHGFREIIEHQAAHVLSPDIQKVGGIFEGRKIADLADMYYLPIAFHNISSPIGTIAACHVAAAIPNFLYLEYHGDSVPFWNELVLPNNKSLIENGFVTLPKTPGLGVELNEEVAKQYAKKSEPFF